MSPGHFEAVLKELPALISEGDLHVSQLALTLLTSITRRQRVLLPMIENTILPGALNLTRSPLLQGVALNSMLVFLTELVTSSESKLKYKDLLQVSFIDVGFFITFTQLNFVVHLLLSALISSEDFVITGRGIKE